MGPTSKGSSKGRGGEGGEGVRWGGERRGEEKGKVVPTNIRDALTPLAGTRGNGVPVYFVSCQRERWY